eukprot:tig00000350_g24309.t1
MGGNDDEHRKSEEWQAEEDDVAEIEEILDERVDEQTKARSYYLRFANDPQGYLVPEADCDADGLIAAYRRVRERYLSDTGCVVCPCEDGVLKRTADNRWIHMVCAEMFGLYFMDTDSRNAVGGLSRIPPDRWDETCGICSRKGVCLTCSKDGCGERFHAACGRALRNVIRVQGANDAPEAFCEKHSAELRAERRAALAMQEEQAQAEGNAKAAPADAKAKARRIAPAKGGAAAGDEEEKAGKGGRKKESGKKAAKEESEGSESEEAAPKKGGKGGKKAVAGKAKGAGKGGRKGRKGGSESSASEAEEEEESEASESERAAKGKRKKGPAGKGAAGKRKKGKNASSSDEEDEEEAARGKRQTRSSGGGASLWGKPSAGGGKADAERRKKEAAAAKAKAKAAARKKSKGRARGEASSDEEESGSESSSSSSSSSSGTSASDASSTIVCEICGSGEHTESNAIVGCDGCDIWVHQDCYGLRQVPQGDWYCEKCSAEIEAGTRKRKGEKSRREAEAKAKKEAEIAEKRRVGCSWCWMPLPPQLLAKRLKEPKSSVHCSDCVAGRTKVQKVLGMRAVAGGEREYFVKWAGLSYRQCSWTSAERTKQLGANVLGMFHRAHGKGDEPADTAAEEEAEADGDRRVADARNCPGVEARWLVPERILASRLLREGDRELVPSMHKAGERFYLVKWCGLDLEEATWELASFVAREFPQQLEAYRRMTRSALRLAAAGPGKKGDFVEWKKQPSYLHGGTLHAYQLEGVNWLRYKWCEGTNVILADEMGLGKTIQAASFLGSLREHGVRGPFLVVAPLSTLPNWERELTAWIPDMCTVVYQGRAESRSVINKYSMFLHPDDVSDALAPPAPEAAAQPPAPSRASSSSLSRRRKGPAAAPASAPKEAARPPADALSDEVAQFAKGLAKEAKGSRPTRLPRFNVLVTSYDMIIMDRLELGRIEWHCTIVDEGHNRLKDAGTRLYSQLGSLKCPYRVLLTGTPLQNNLEELFNLLAFVEPDKFPDPAAIAARFNSSFTRARELEEEAAAAAAASDSDADAEGEGSGSGSGSGSEGAKGGAKKGKTKGKGKGKAAGDGEEGDKMDVSGGEDGKPAKGATGKKGKAGKKQESEGEAEAGAGKKAAGKKGAAKKEESESEADTAGKKGADKKGDAKKGADKKAADGKEKRKGKASPKSDDEEEEKEEDDEDEEDEKQKGKGKAKGKKVAKASEKGKEGKGKGKKAKGGKSDDDGEEEDASGGEGEPEELLTVDQLHAMLAPHMLRRFKHDIQKEIPPKVELVLPTGLSQDQRKLYQAALGRNIATLRAGTKKTNSTALNNVLMELRKIVNSAQHSRGVPDEWYDEDWEGPDSGDEEGAPGEAAKGKEEGKAEAAAAAPKIKEEPREEAPGEKGEKGGAEVKGEKAGGEARAEVKKEGSAEAGAKAEVKKEPADTPAAALKSEPRADTAKPPPASSFLPPPLRPPSSTPRRERRALAIKGMLEASAKLQLLDRMLAKLRAGGNRVLIFSLFTTMLDVLERYVDLRRYPYERIDGHVASIDRQAAIDRFNAPDSDRFVFLLSTRAGGLGINLATADTIFLFDSDWNPQSDMQAMARAHRIGQTKQLMVYRFVTKSSVEERIAEMSKRKLMLEHLAVNTMDTKGRTKLSPGELQEILKHGASKIFQGDVEVHYSEEDIEALLDRARHARALAEREKAEGVGEEARMENERRVMGHFSEARVWEKQRTGEAEPEETISIDHPQFWDVVVDEESKAIAAAEAAAAAAAAREEDVFDEWGVRKRRRARRDTNYAKFLDEEELEQEQGEGEGAAGPSGGRRASKEGKGGRRGAHGERKEKDEEAWEGGSSGSGSGAEEGDDDSDPEALVAESDGRRRKRPRGSPPLGHGPASGAPPPPPPRGPPLHLPRAPGPGSTLPSSPSCCAGPCAAPRPPSEPAFVAQHGSLADKVMAELAKKNAGAAPRPPGAPPTCLKISIPGTIAARSPHYWAVYRAYYEAAQRHLGGEHYAVAVDVPALHPAPAPPQAPLPGPAAPSPSPPPARRRPRRHPAPPRRPLSASPRHPPPPCPRPPAPPRRRRPTPGVAPVPGARAPAGASAVPTAAPVSGPKPVAGAASASGAAPSTSGAVPLRTPTALAVPPPAAAPAPAPAVPLTSGFADFFAKASSSGPPPS